MNTYAITDILLKQNILMLSKFNNINKERVVKWFLKNVWKSTIKTEYELDKRIDLNKLFFHKSVPHELKNITKVFYAWGQSLTDENIKDITKLVSLQIKPNANGGVNIKIDFIKCC